MLRRARGAARAGRSTAWRSSGCGAPSSATAARRGRSRSSCRAGPPDLAALIAAFEDEHERLYGVRGEPGSPIVIRALRLAALGPSSAVDRLALDDAAAGPAGHAHRVASAASPSRRPGPHAARRSAPRPRPGPLLVDEYDTTVVVRPGWTVRRDAATETLILERPDALSPGGLPSGTSRVGPKGHVAFGRSGYPPPAPMRSSLPPKS